MVFANGDDCGKPRDPSLVAKDDNNETSFTASPKFAHAGVCISSAIPQLDDPAISATSCPNRPPLWLLR